MIIGFGFGSPLTAILMLLVTSLLSYGLFRWMRTDGRSDKFRTEDQRREQLRRYYREQRELARRLTREFDLSDEEIEQKVEQELMKHQ